jgi:hypothetical protein
MKKPLTPADVASNISAENKVEVKETQTIQTQALSATDLVHNFMSQNNIKPKLIVIEELNVWDGHSGILLNDKPLLKLTFEYINK